MRARDRAKERTGEEANRSKGKKVKRKRQKLARHNSENINQEKFYPEHFNKFRINYVEGEKKKMNKKE